jgi:hypothetical protein
LKYRELRLLYLNALVKTNNYWKFCYFLHGYHKNQFQVIFSQKQDDFTFT